MDNQTLIRVPKHTLDSYVFKHNINRVWDVVKDVTLNPTVLDNKSICQKVEIIKGENTWEVGNQFVMTWRHVLDITYIVEDVVVKEDYRLIKFKAIASKPIELDFAYQYSLHTTTNDHYTLMIIEVFHAQDQFMTPEQKKYSELERKEVLTLFDKYLSTSVKDLYQVESIMIKTNLRKLWSIVTNWVEFKNLVPFIAEKVVYLGDPLKKDSKLLLKWTSKNIECHLKVVDIIDDDEDSELVYTMECYGGEPKPPMQSLSFTLYKLGADSSFLEFKHVFHEPILYDVMQNISQDKQKILLELRKKMEES